METRDTDGVVGITPTVGVLNADGALGAGESFDGVTLFAPHLHAANITLTAMVDTSPRRWPADTRFAAPPQPVVAVPSTLPDLDDDWRTAFDSAVKRLAAEGARIVPTDLDPAAPLLDDGTDALLVPTATALVGLCAVSVAASGSVAAQFGVTVLAREFDDAVAFDIAALLSEEAPPHDVWPLAGALAVELVVFGAHLRGGALAFQLTDLGARWAGEIRTAPRYRMTVLDTVPPKPAVERVATGGTALLGHRWLLSPAALGAFLAALPAPMQLGKVECDDDTWRTGFGCDSSAATGPDISNYGSWPDAVAAGAVG